MLHSLALINASDNSTASGSEWTRCSSPSNATTAPYRSLLFTQKSPEDIVKYSSTLTTVDTTSTETAAKTVFNISMAGSETHQSEHVCRASNKL